MTAPPPKKKKTGPRIRFGAKVEEGVWGALNAKEDKTGNKENGSHTTASTNEVLPTTQPSQETLDSTVSSMQSSFQQEVEKANLLRKEAAEANERSLMAMQEKVNSKLQEMDNTIKIVHEGQTLNDKNIQMMMTKMDIFSAQMQLLQGKIDAAPSGEDNEKKREKESPRGVVSQALAITTPTKHVEDEEAEWNDDFVNSPQAFDAIMADAETKKRVAEDSSLAKAKKKKSQPATNTRSRAGRGR